MYELLESRRDIALAHRTLDETLKAAFKGTISRDIGWQGGRQRGATLNTSGRYWYWSRASRRDAANPRQLNWFGTFGEGRGVQIAVEINTPYEGRNGAVAGFFARHTRTGKIYLFHSGRVGGGATGVSKDAFLAWAEWPTETITDAAGRQFEGVVVTPVSGRGVKSAVIAYVQSVIDFKQHVRSRPPGEEAHGNTPQQDNEMPTPPAGTMEQRLTWVRKHHERFRDPVRRHWNWRCAVSGETCEGMLVASHIFPWAESTGAEKTDPNNGLLLSVPLDKLFDRGLIAFADDGEMLCSDQLDERTQALFGLPASGYRIADPSRLTRKMRQYLARHRARHGFE
jgi:hypothetical protein